MVHTINVIYHGGYRSRPGASARAAVERGYTHEMLHGEGFQNLIFP